MKHLVIAFYKYVTGKTEAELRQDWWWYYFTSRSVAKAYWHTLKG